MSSSTTPSGLLVAPGPALADRPTPVATGSVLRRAYRWHRPLMIMALASLALLVCCVLGMVVDPRRLTGLPIWDKPAKFSLSIAIYASSLAWLISIMPRRKRLGSVLGTVTALMLAGELAAIVAQVVRGRASHFDFGTPLDAAIYQSMAVMVATLWLANVALVVVLLTQRLGDLALTWALRLGMIIAVVGMGLAYLMTLPTPAQRASWDAGADATVIGAHSVGVPDGGPGLPVLGWSTVGGDLRIPHFVGIHGLQVMIVVGLLLTFLAPRVPTLAAVAVRLRLVVVAALGYAGILAVLTVQALRGQSVVHPDLVTAGTTAAVVGLTLGAALLVLRGRAGAGVR